MTAAILSIGTATPAVSIAQEEALAVARELTRAPEEEARILAALYRRSNIRRRGSVILEIGRAGTPPVQRFFPPAVHRTDRGPTTAARGDRYAAEAPGLAMAAARGALLGAAQDAQGITHLITVSCTGFNAPGVDAALIKELGLANTVQRTHVGFMGCHGAINGLRVAAAFAAADPSVRVLLCAVELCSLHFHYAPDPQQAVANALFADGAAAAVVVPAAERATGVPRIVATASCLLPDCEDAMTWRIGDNGFEMTLSARVPAVLQTHLRPWLEPWLMTHGLTIEEVGSWAVHPGGPRILGTVAESLGLSSGALDASREILAERGNMSSPTVLFILERLRERGSPMPAVMLGFGPGLVAEAALLL